MGDLWENNIRIIIFGVVTVWSVFGLISNRY